MNLSVYSYSNKYLNNGQKGLLGLRIRMRCKTQAGFLAKSLPTICIPVAKCFFFPFILHKS